MNKHPENALDAANDAWSAVTINGKESAMSPPIPSWFDNSPPVDAYNDTPQDSNTNKEVKAITSLFNLEDARVILWIDTQPLPRKWILKDCLPCSKVGIIVAPGGTGKSQYAIQLLISVATGIPLANAWDIDETGSVVALFAEEDTEELHRRLHNTVKTSNLTDDKVRLIKERVFIKSVVGENNFMTAKNENGELAETIYLECLLNTIAEIKDLKIIIIDPLSRFRGGNEIDNDDATRFVIVLEKLAQLTGATVIGLHHASKASMNDDTSNQSASRGASALVDGVRWVMNLQIMSDREAKKYSIKENRKGYYIKCTVTKNNYGPPQSGEIWLERGDYGVLELISLQGSKEELLEARKKKILEIIARDTALDKEYSMRGFRDKYAGTANETGIGDKNLRVLLNELLEEKQIILSPPKNPERNKYKVLNAAPTLKEQEQGYRRISDGE